MSKNNYFKEWLGKSPEKLYGFTKDYSISDKKISQIYELEPMEPIKVSDIMKELLQLGKVGTKSPNRLFENKIVYDSPDDVGNLTVEVSPFGSLKIIIRKSLKNLTGEVTNICKKVLPLINDYNHVGPTDHQEEFNIANSVNRFLTSLDSKGIDTARNDYDGLRTLTLQMGSAAKKMHPKVMIYNGIVENTKNYYTIYFSYSGQGVEAPSANRAEQFNINLSYSDKTGLIRCWGNEILSPTKQHLWRLQPSEWDEYFTPSQSSSEIIDCIQSAFMTY